ncbi:MAG TPA: ABC transporter permease subunit [Synechococcales cyanobacterium M55_K2018_004]|nr:ABC transporter permease subunit [Synechococcales cyanobacterium M55_K2018_004]
MNLGRVLVIAVNVFREVIRDRILYLIALFAIALVIAATLLPQLAAGTTAKILLDLGLAAINLLGLVVAVFVGTGLVNKEIEKRTVYVLMAKPVSKTEFIVGKHLGLSAVLAVLLAAMTAIYLLVLTYKGVAFPLEGILLAVLFQFLELSLITAVAILMGVFTSSVLATLLTFAVYLMGHLSRDLVTLGKLSQTPTIERFTQALYLVLPDLARLNLKNQAVYSIELFPSPVELGLNALYALVYTALLLAIATFIFSRREF